MCSFVIAERFKKTSKQSFYLGRPLARGARARATSAGSAHQQRAQCASRIFRLSRSNDLVNHTGNRSITLMSNEYPLSTMLSIT